MKQRIDQKCQYRINWLKFMRFVASVAVFMFVMHTGVTMLAASNAETTSAPVVKTGQIEVPVRGNQLPWADRSTVSAVGTDAAAIWNVATTDEMAMISSDGRYVVQMKESSGCEVGDEIIIHLSSGIALDAVVGQVGNQFAFFVDEANLAEICKITKDITELGFPGYIDSIEYDA